MKLFWSLNDIDSVHKCPIAGLESPPQKEGQPT